MLLIIPPTPHGNSPRLQILESENGNEKLSAREFYFLEKNCKILSTTIIIIKMLLC